MKKIAPSILSADFSALGREISAVEKAGADLIHIDVMDGHFVPNITIGPLVVKAVRGVTGLPLDVHLMIENPDTYIPAFAEAGADMLSVHVEACRHLNRTLDLIRSCGCKPGVAINPATPLETLRWVKDQVAFIMLMSVNPGFGGQDFIKNSIERIKKLKQMISDEGRDIMIEVDGGINSETIGSVSRAGADIFVAGSAIFKRKDYGRAISDLRRNAK